MEIIFLVKSNDLRFVDSINNDKAAACLVAAGEKPSFDELQGFASYAMTGKLATYSKATN